MNNTKIESTISQQALPTKKKEMINDTFTDSIMQITKYARCLLQMHKNSKVKLTEKRRRNLKIPRNVYIQ